MVAKKRRLGRGLDALLGAAQGAGRVDDADADGPDDGHVGDSLRQLPLDLIRRGRYQPRVDMHPDTLEELAASIRAQGVVQPIVVRTTATGDYELIAGERRWRAAQMAGLHEIPAVVRDVPDRAVLAMALIENIQRENLNPLEEASALERLIEEFGMTHQEAADAVGRSRAAVSNLLRLLELNPEVKTAVASGTLEMGHARALLALPRADQPGVARKVAERGLSVRETERLVKSIVEQPKQPSRREAELDPDIRRLQTELSEHLGARTEIKHGAAGKGKVIIEYNSLDELDGILSRFRESIDPV
jgi:ParB family chromosome partitioning protein